MLLVPQGEAVDISNKQIWISGGARYKFKYSTRGWHTLYVAWCLGLLTLIKTPNTMIMFRSDSGSGFSVAGFNKDTSSMKWWLNHRQHHGTQKQLRPCHIETLEKKVIIMDHAFPFGESGMLCACFPFTFPLLYRWIFFILDWQAFSCAF